MRKTKIVCTIGPSSSSAEVIEAMIKNGMNVARLNFSHGNHNDHEEKIKIIRDTARKLGTTVAILQDLAGPKIRVGFIANPGVILEPGRDFILTSLQIEGNSSRVSVSYPNLPGEVNEGDHLLLADGLMELVVVETTATDIKCRVITGGILTSHKGINLTTGTIHAPSLTEKDHEDLLFGLEHDVDYVAMSFVKAADDIRMIKEIISKKGNEVPVIAKIEKHEALARLDEIIEISDGIMVARGDLGVEIPPEDVPLIQKNIIQKANYAGKPVITATQMLRSMVSSPRPTRAEAADVANAVLDGTDAVMLSEETASGSYPVEAVRFMNRITTKAETGFPYETFLHLTPRKEISPSVAHASCVLADHLNAAAIVAHTRSGRTAEYISRFRPSQPIIALSPDDKTLRKLSLFWGCLPCLTTEPQNTDDMIANAARSALATGEVSEGDILVITLGHPDPVWKSGITNMIRVKKL
jgi:pyruvate kinase